jgi:CRP-like cAMP-binding protein
MLRPHLEFVELPKQHILFEQGAKIEDVYFPDDGMVSLVVLARDGRSVEVGIVGREGAVGIPRSFGLSRAPYRAISQIPGRSMRLRGDTLDELLPFAPRLQFAFGKHSLLQGLQMGQIAACNRLHEISPRLARWLLMCQDRAGREILPVTHELLAQMLGTGRPSISLAAGMLDRAGVIANLRGRMKILDRRSLERAACECYSAMQIFSEGIDTP